LPADAQLWFDDYQTSQTGADRTFETPPLDSGRSYHYQLRARWKEGGHEVDRSRTIHFRPGEHVLLDLHRPEAEALAPPNNNERTASSAGRTLFDRLGGEPAIRGIVDDLVARLAADPRVNFNRKGTPREWTPTPENVAALKKYMVEFLGHATGGPEKYEGDNMKAVHKGMHITDREFDAFLDDVKASLEKYHVSQQKQRDVLNLLEGTRKNIVGD
jgi:hemoglobin